MSKRNRDNISTITFKGDTLIEQFDNYIGKDTKNVHKMVEALSIINARCIAMFGSTNGDIRKIPVTKRDEIIQFADYFIENYGEITEKARYNNWGPDDAFVLRLAGDLDSYRIEAEYAQKYNNMTEGQQKEVDTLTSKLFDVRKDRLICFSWEDHSYFHQVPHTLPRFQLNDVKKALKAYTTAVIDNRGSIVVREFKTGFDQKKCFIYGFRVNPFGVWESITKEEMEYCHCLGPNGEKLPPEKGVTYTSRPKEVGSTTT